MSDLMQESVTTEKLQFGAQFQRGLQKNFIGNESKINGTTVMRYPTSSFERTVQFWTRISEVYGTYKMCQLKANFLKSKEEREKMWETQHEEAAVRLYNLCVHLGGFFLKAGQTLAKPDLSPMPWVRKLSRLHDSAPADDFGIVKVLIESELGKGIEESFLTVEENPIGSASIAQVHRGKLKSGKTVAIKVQHAGVESLMLTDLKNLKNAAAFLQKFELKIDLVSMINELESQIKHEFDFRLEARNMDSIGDSLSNFGRKLNDKRQKGSKGCSPIIVPRSIPGMVTGKVLVMDFIEGVQIMKMGEAMKKKGVNPNGNIAHIAKKNILTDLTSAYGHMILKDGHFQADPHPGNILICEGGKVALLDYGQTKQLPNDLRLKLAELVLAVAREDVNEIGRQFKRVGILTQRNAQESPNSFRRMGLLMFDTKTAKGITTSSPFAKESTLKSNAILAFPEDLFFVLRTMQLLRGLSTGMGVNFSAAQQWVKIAEEALREAKN